MPLELDDSKLNSVNKQAGSASDIKPNEAVFVSAAGDRR